MKKFTKIISILLAVIMILSTTSITAFAASYNTAQTAESIGIGTTNTTFKYGYANQSYDSYVSLTEKYFSFVPSYTGYYEFTATGYENTSYVAGSTPSVSVGIRDASGNTLRYLSTNEYNLQTKGACELTAGQIYYIDLEDYLYDTTSYKNSEYGYAEQTIALTIAPHSHTLKTTNYSTFNYNECLYCDYDEYDYNVSSVADVHLNKYVYIYNGKVQVPTVIAIDNKGNRISSSAYTVNINGNKKTPNSYKLTVKFGESYHNYSCTFTYLIRPKGTSISKLTSKKKGFTVKLKKQTTKTSGYCIRYSTNSSMKNAKTVYVKGNKNTKKTISKLKGKKKYYVQVATYKTLKNGKIVSSFSKTKSVKTK